MTPAGLVGSRRRPPRGVGTLVGVLVVVLLALTGCGDPEVARPTTSTTRPATTTCTTSTSSTSSTGPTTTTSQPPTTTTRAPGAPAQQIRRGDPTRARVAFSFDAGSDAGHAREILAILEAEGITASFGICGTWARANPDLTRTIAAGHHLLNHTDAHRSFTGFSTGTDPLTRAERQEALRRADLAVAAIAGVPTMAPWFRPPYGDTDASVDADIAAIGYRYDVLWTVDSLGWKGLAPAAVVQRCLDGAQNGAIYLFHVGSASTDAAALPAIIAGLRARGYEIGPVPFVL